MATSSEILRERGYVYQQSSETLEEITDGAPRTVYLGVDPTADSIHLGNFAQYMFLRRFAEAGHKVILIIGGGTALAGDPKPDVERELTDGATVAARAEKLKAQAQKIMGGVELQLVNNADWLTKLNLMEFLRDTGKYFTVNNLVKKDAISARMASEEGISFTEFSYPLLQAYDFWHLYKTYGCEVQIGGSDQWGNIVAGVDLIRKKEGATAYAISSPLIVEKSTGKKFGKSEGNAIWLDAEKSSPFKFYQFFLNVEDDMVEELLLKMTLLSKEDIAAVCAEPAETRAAQKQLAAAVTELVHGKDVMEAAKAEGELRFKKDLSPEEQAQLRSGVASGTSLADVLVQGGYVDSKSAARRLIEGNAVKINGTLVSDTDKVLTASDHNENGMIILTAGKSQPSSVLAIE